MKCAICNDRKFILVNINNGNGLAIERCDECSDESDDVAVERAYKKAVLFDKALEALRRIVGSYPDIGDCFVDAGETVNMRIAELETVEGV
jgi:hypothetical protein